jgi:hypothetical protein
MKHLLNEANKWHNQQLDPNATEYQIKADKLFNQFQLQIQSKTTKPKAITMAAIIKN